MPGVSGHPRGVSIFIQGLFLEILSDLEKIYQKMYCGSSFFVGNAVEMRADTVIRYIEYCTLEGQDEW